MLSRHSKASVNRALEVLANGIKAANGHPGFVLADLCWKALWAIFTAALAAFAVLTLLAEIGSFEWEGPELGNAGPILLLAALRAFWDACAAYAAGVLVIFAVTAWLLWLALESLFRGGRKHFWIYFASGAGRSGALAAAVLIMATLLGIDDRSILDNALIAGIVILGVWFIAAVLETAIRRDAVPVIAVDLGLLSGVMALLLGVELVLGIVLGGIGLAAIARVSEPGEFVIAGMLLLTNFGLWTMIHSYLILIRYSAVDIMRHNVVD